MVDYYVTNSFSTVKRTSCCFTIFFDKQIAFKTFPYGVKIGNYRVTNSKVLCQPDKFNSTEEGVKLLLEVYAPCRNGFLPNGTYLDMSEYT